MCLAAFGPVKVIVQCFHDGHRDGGCPKDDLRIGEQTEWLQEADACAEDNNRDVNAAAERVVVNVAIGV